MLVAEFECVSGRARVYDCFAVREGGSRRPRQQLLRIAKGVEGEVWLES